MSKIQGILEELKTRKDWKNPAEVQEFFEKSLHEVYQEGIEQGEKEINERANKNLIKN
jgi:hypothetical protein